MPVESWRLNSRIKAGGSVLAHDRRGPTRQQTVHIRVLGAFPGARGAVAPARRLRQESQRDLIAPLDEACRVLRRRHRAVVEEVLVDAVAEQRHVIRVPFGEEHAEDAPGAVARQSPGLSHGRPVATVAREPVGVVEQELEAAPGLHRSDTAVLVLRVPEHEHEHVVDVVFHVEVRLHGFVVVPQGLDPRPGRAIAIVGDAGVGPSPDVPVAVDGLVVPLVAT